MINVNIIKLIIDEYIIKLIFKTIKNCIKITVYMKSVEYLLPNHCSKFNFDSNYLLHLIIL